MAGLFMSVTSSFSYISPITPYLILGIASTLSSSESPMTLESSSSISASVASTLFVPVSLALVISPS